MGLYQIALSFLAAIAFIIAPQVLRWGMSQFDRLRGATESPDLTEYMSPEESAGLAEVLARSRLDQDIVPLHGTGRDTRPGRAGIKNVGNSCYLAPVIQILAHSRRFVDALFDTEFAKPNPAQEEFLKMVIDMWSYNEHGTPLDPSGLLRALRKAAGDRSFNAGVHEDAHQAMKTILSHLGEASVSHPGETSVFEDMFAVQFDRSRICHGCGKLRSSRITEHDIFLPLQDVQSSGGLVHLYDLFTDRLSPVVNEYLNQCESCHGHRVQIDQDTIGKAGELLLVALNRFDSTLRPIETFVEYPIHLDLNKISGSHGLPKYKLVGVIHRSGETTQFGHYTAQFYHDVHKEWVDADDQTVSSVEGELGTISNTVYVLLYEMV